MDFKKIIKILLLVVVLLAITLFGITLYQKYSTNNDNESNKSHDLIPKKYQVNEYSIINIDDRQIANIYLMDYKNELLSDRQSAYDHLNISYREKKFNSIEEFNNVINNYDISNMSLKQFSFSTNRRFLKVYFSDKDSFIFKIKGILDYEVYLDDTTVEME